MREVRRCLMLLPLLLQRLQPLLQQQCLLMRQQQCLLMRQQLLQRQKRLLPSDQLLLLQLHQKGLKQLLVLVLVLYGRQRLVLQQRRLQPCACLARCDALALRRLASFKDSLRALFYQLRQGVHLLDERRVLSDLQQMLLELPRLLLGLLRMQRCKLLISSQFPCHKTGG